MSTTRRTLTLALAVMAFALGPAAASTHDQTPAQTHAQTPAQTHAARSAADQPATVIVMRASVSVPGDAPVLLRDVAQLTGPAAAQLGTLVVLHASEAPSGTAGAIVIRRDKVRSLLEAAGANLGTTLVRGRTTSVLIEAASDDAPEETLQPAPTPATTPAPTPAPAAALTPDAPTTSMLANSELISPAPTAVEATSTPPSSSTTNAPAQPSSDPLTLPGTMRALISQQIARELSLPEQEVQVRFEASSTRDAPWLDRPTPADWRARITISGFGVNGRTPVRVEAFAGDRVALDASVQAVTRVRTRVPVAAVALSRDAPIDAASVRLDERWQPAGQAEPTRLDQLIGTTARRRIEPGRPITAGDVTTPIVIRRGEEVWVECISGPLVVRAKARATENARDGELVRLSIDNSKRTLTARMNGRGRAVMTLTDDEASLTTDPLPALAPLSNAQSP